MKKLFPLAALLLAAALLLSGCGFSSLTYAHQEQYAAGNAQIAKTVENLDINWLDGSVTIVYGDQAGVTLAETAQKKLSGGERMQWWLDGVTLRVQYAESGLRWNSVAKHLTVTLPAGTVLKDVRIGCTTGSIQAAPFYGENVVFSTTTGSIRTECAASSLNLSATTGSITLRGAANTVTLNATTGKIDAVIEHADEFLANVTTGRLSLDLDDVRQASVSAATARIDILTDRVNTLAVNNTTGSVSVRCRRAPSETLVTTTTGAISLALPSGAGFTAQVGTRTGGVHVNLPAQNVGNRYVSGTGAAMITLSTVSGSITMDEYRE